MVELNQRERTIRVKIVYYGPAAGGKTTNLRVIHQNALGARRGEILSVNSEQERTILFDLLPLKTSGFRGFDLRLQLVAAPGQAMFAATRRIVLKGADGVVFVANSAMDRWEENLQSFQEMTHNLLAHQLDPYSIPIIFQYNKRDLPQVTAIEVLEDALNPRHQPSFPAVAFRGMGVLETLAAILARTIGAISQRFRAIELPPGLEPEEWAERTVDDLFGRTRPGAGDEARADGGAFEEAPQETEEAPLLAALEESSREDRRVVRVALAGEADRHPGAGGPEARAEDLVQSYAEASAELGVVVSELREERDQARTRLEDVQRTIAVAHELLTDQPFEAGVRHMLSCLAEAAGASHATHCVARGGAAFEALPLPPLTQDPLLRMAWGAQRLVELREQTEPRLDHVSDDPAVRWALEQHSPPFIAVATVPLRAGDRLFGFAMLYFAGEGPVPAEEGLKHLGLLARVFCAPLELAARGREARRAERMARLALLASASTEECLEALARGAVRREPVDLEGLLAPVRAEDIPVEIAPGASRVRADPALLRLALVSLVNRCEAAALAAHQDSSTAVRGRLEQARVRIEVTHRATGTLGPRPPAEDPPDAAETALSFVRSLVQLGGGRLEASPAGAQASAFAIELEPG